MLINTALVLEVSPLPKGRVDVEYSGTEQVVKNSERQGEHQKLYSTGIEKEEKGVLQVAVAIVLIFSFTFRGNLFQR